MVSELTSYDWHWWLTTIIALSGAIVIPASIWWFGSVHAVVKQQSNTQIEHLNFLKVLINQFIIKLISLDNIAQVVLTEISTIKNQKKSKYNQFIYQHLCVGFSDFDIVMNDYNFIAKNDETLLSYLFDMKMYLSILAEMINFLNSELYSFSKSTQKDYKSFCESSEINFGKLRCIIYGEIKCLQQILYRLLIFDDKHFQSQKTYFPLDDEYYKKIGELHEFAKEFSGVDI